MLERGVPRNIGLHCIEVLVYIYIYIGVPYTTLGREVAQGMGVKPPAAAAPGKP
jgi:hypothetical protein